MWMTLVPLWSNAFMRGTPGTLIVITGSIALGAIVNQVFENV